MTKFFNKKKTPPLSLIHIVNDVTEIHKLTIKELATRYSIVLNWKRNRPVDNVRIQAIKSWILESGSRTLPGVIYAWDTGDGMLHIFDGVHRYFAGIASDNPEITMLIQIHKTTEENDIIDEFRYINSSCPVPMLYMEEFDERKKIVCENIVRYLVEKYPKCVSPSKYCHSQNFNTSITFQWLSEFNIDFTDKNIEFKLKNCLQIVNIYAKQWISDNKIIAVKKSEVYQFWLFYLEKSYIRSKIESMIRNNMSL